MDYSTEALLAGLQSQINGWVIEIQMLNEKIKEMQEKINEIKDKYIILE